MKIRTGYVTNSSSTNFLIISKKELTVGYLFEKLGFRKNSPLEGIGLELCENIIQGIDSGLRWFDFDDITYEHVKEVFGLKSANKFKELKGKNYHAYWGHSNSDDGALTCFFTTDTFEIEEKDLYINGRNCVW